MQFECNREKLIQTLQQTEKVSRKNLSLPILSKVLLETEGNQILFRVTNLTIGATLRVPASVGEQGKVAVDGGLLLQILQQTKRIEKISFAQEEQSLVLRAEGLEATVQTYPIEDFPSLPSVEDDAPEMALPVDALVSGVKSVVYAAAVNDIKPEIASVYIYRDEKDILFVATDSFRLAEKRISGILSETSSLESLLLPASSLQEIVRMIEGSSGDITVRIGDSMVEFSGDRFVITQRLVAGSFPDYRLIIPKDFQAEAVVLKQELIDQLRLVTLFSDKFQQLDVVINPEDKKLQVAAMNSDVGSGTVQVLGSLKGEALEIRLNHRYVLDGFQSMVDDSVELLFAGERKPIVVRGITDKSFTYLVMPMNR